MALEEQSLRHTFKIVVIGDIGVGKTSIIQRYVDPKSNILTLGDTFEFKIIDIKDKGVKLHIWEHTDVDRFRTQSGSIFRGTNGVIAVYDVTNEKSFRQIPSMLDEVDRYCVSDIPTIIVGNKADLISVEGHCISKDEIESFCDRYDTKHFEVSAKLNDTIDKMFDSIVEDILAVVERQIEETIPVRVTTTKSSPFSETECCLIM